MVSSDTARNVVGILGNIISLFLFLSPVPTFVQIWKKKAVEQYSATPYLATLVNCMVWVLYGLPMVHPKSLLVITINGTGTAIEIIYIIIFIIYSDKKKRLKVVLIIIVEVVFVAVLALLVLTLAHTTKKRSMIVGIVCICFNIVMYASPLSVIKMVLTTKSVEYMPFTLSLAAFANGLAWSCYAFIRFDPFIIIPNGLGTLFALAQLALYAVFYKSTKRQMEARKGKVEVGLSEIVVNGNANSKRTGPEPLN
ncbi:bidirectional sugar transporter SWEET4 [Mercurialis annua]|uniref:bidirectional sugar transporter SWEET4 n=1 Tax=Mercurialis annua TaxID=3986 RepID=UPI00215DF3DA|nr:bidirectional sugar transporter SWEET4 [Mercurialis annua]